MDERQIETRLKRAMNGPPVPQELVERTVARANAIIAGREAERKLADLGSASVRDHPRLAAQSVVGRLMLTARPPGEMTPEALTDEMENSKKFLDTVDSPADVFLADLQSGRLMGRFRQASAPQRAQEPEPAAPEKQMSAIEIRPPAKGGMGI